MCLKVTFKKYQVLFKSQLVKYNHLQINLTSVCDVSSMKVVKVINFFLKEFQHKCGA